MNDDAAPMLDQVNLVVRDMAAMAEFYGRLGLSLPGGDPTWDRHHRSADHAGPFDFDLDSSEFTSIWNAGWPAGRTGVVLGFRVISRDDVDRLYGELTGAGYKGQQPPYDAFWGARYAIVEDPDGNSVGLMSPIDPSMRHAPPDPPS